MVTEEHLNSYSRVLGLRLDSILLEADHRDRLIAESTYKTQRWQLRQRLNGLDVASTVPEAAVVLWKNGEAILLPSGYDTRSESNVDDAAV